MTCSIDVERRRAIDAAADAAGKVDAYARAISAGLIGPHNLYVGCERDRYREIGLRHDIFTFRFKPTSCPVGYEQASITLFGATQYPHLPMRRGEIKMQAGRDLRTFTNR